MLREEQTRFPQKFISDSFFLYLGTKAIMDDALFRFLRREISFFHLFENTFRILGGIESFEPGIGLCLYERLFHR